MKMVLGWSLGGIVKVIPTKYYTDGSGTTYRKKVENGIFRVDRTLTALGFSGIKDTDWETIFSTTNNG